MKRFSKLISYGTCRQILASWYLTILFPAITAMYVAVVGGWQDIPFVKNYKQIHLAIFLTVISIDFLLRVLKGAGDLVLANNPVIHSKALIELLKSVTSIIEAKTERFRKAYLNLGSSSPFERITHPEDQIKTIMREARNYYSYVGNKEDTFDATIIRRPPNSNGWEFFSQLDANYSHGSATELMAGATAARHVRESGQEVFFPSKNSAASMGLYQIGDRDKKRGGDGSVYCKHIKVDTPRGADEFILTFITYACTVCDTGDEESCIAWKTVFGEFARRIELELILLSIKNYRQYLNAKKASERPTKGLPKQRGKSKGGE